jgi:hypothetical protein
MMTVLLDFQMSNITIDQRSEPYYKQYHHCLIWWIPEGNMLRVVSHKAIDSNVHWRNNYLQNWGRNSRKGEVTERETERLHEVCDKLLAIPNPYKKVVCNNTMWFYTNNPEDFDDIVTHEGTKLIDCKQADISLPADCVLLNNPKHKFRTYFRERYLDEDQRKAIQRYFTSRAEQFRPGPGFKSLLHGLKLWTSSYYFVDHDDEKDALFINLACPQLVRKTLPIRARN